MLKRRVFTMRTFELCTRDIFWGHLSDHGMRAHHINNGNQCFYTIKNATGNLVQFANSSIMCSQFGFLAVNNILWQSSLLQYF